MRIVIHDFAGHPFQIQLSRALARRDHQVTHIYPGGLEGPKGRVQTDGEDSKSLEVLEICLGRSMKKYSPLSRLLAHRRYSQRLKHRISAVNPDVVLSANTPIDVQNNLQSYCSRRRIRFVHWVQDVYCEALEFFLRKRIPLLASSLTVPWRMLEKKVARRSDACVVISSDFRDLLVKWHVPRDHITVRENWAALAELPLMDRKNSWSARYGLADKFVFLYSGTLGLKHQPSLLYKLAEVIGDSGMVVVVAQGPGRDYLESMPKRSNMLMLPYQPYSELPNVLATADVLVTTLELGAGQFAVPSKLLTYLCAGKPQLVAAPSENLAARVIERSGAGIVVNPTDLAGWERAALQLSTGRKQNSQLGAKARAYAERNFDIEQIASEFEAICFQRREQFHAAACV